MLCSESSSPGIRVSISPEAYLWLVHRVAGQLVGKVPSSVPLDDLVQAGMKGLVESASRYRTDSESPFTAFAFLRIKGAMLDHLRSLDRVGRESRQRLKRLQSARRTLEQVLGHEPSEVELAEFLDRSVDQVRKDEALAAETVVRTNGDFGTARSDPHRDAVKNEVRQSLTESLGALPTKDYLVLVLYYNEELTMSEIAGVMDLTESAVSQRHRSAIGRLGQSLRTRYKADALRYGM